MNHPFSEVSSDLNSKSKDTSIVSEPDIKIEKQPTADFRQNVLKTSKEQSLDDMLIGEDNSPDIKSKD